jgi:hypothetical protein
VSVSTRERIDRLLTALDRRVRARRLTGLPANTLGEDAEPLLDGLERACTGADLRQYAAPYFHERDVRWARSAVKRLLNLPLRVFGRPQAWMNQATAQALQSSANALRTTLRIQAALLDLVATQDERLERLAGNPGRAASASAAEDRPLRIGIVSRTYPPSPRVGGVARHADELACALHRLGHEVHVFTETRGVEHPDDPRFVVHGVTTELVPIAPDLPRTDRILRWAVAVNGQIEALARSGTTLDVVESHSWESESLAVVRAGRVPVVVRIQTPLAIVARESAWAPSEDLDTAVALEGWIIGHADGVSHSTDAIRATIEDELNVVVPDDRRACMQYGVPLPAEAPGRPASPPRLLFVGRLEPRKGIDTLLAIVPALLERHPDLQVDVVGQDMTWAGASRSVRQEFEAAHRSAAWRSRCRFHGVVDDRRLAELYRDCTLFVAPSRYESFGLIYLEAMRWGRPVIGCRAGGIPEVVREGETGLLVPPGDAPALQAAVMRLLDDADLRERLGARARATVEAEFSAARMAERTVAFYRRIIARRA